MHPFPVAILLSVGIVPDSSVGPEYSEFKVELPEHFFGPSAAYAALIPSATARGSTALAELKSNFLIADRHQCEDRYRSAIRFKSTFGNQERRISSIALFFGRMAL